MKIDILTLFPEVFTPLNSSIIERAKKGGFLHVNLLDIRDFSKDKHKKVDDEPFGGGAGMLMTAQPIYDASIQAMGQDKEAYFIYMSPKGRRLDAKLAKEIAKKDHIVILCGHYEGVDQRVLDILGYNEVSIGDYVLTGGELPAMVLVDAVSRFVPGVLKERSLEEESFSEGMLEYPQYTRPQEFMGLKVPDVLISGNHAAIEKYRKEESRKITKNKRPDLM